ncbi:MAG TPA: hypothetical protein VMU89_18110 [Thermomicrobiaceae bacterium]|nr:hypothetical protein [Thermomicrobiaceae bacterium]
MAQTHAIRLSPDEIHRQARKFWLGQGLRLALDEPNRLRFTGGEGSVELAVRPDTNNQVRLTIDNQGYEQEIQKFRAILARQATAETNMG